MESRGFEPLTSAVQMRPDESVTVRMHPKCAANPYILMDDMGSLVRPILLATAWVGVRLVSRLDYSRGWDVETLRASSLGLQLKKSGGKQHWLTKSAKPIV